MGCITNIRENLLRMEGVVSVAADVKTQQVSVSAIAVSREAITDRLASLLGYPEKDRTIFWTRPKHFFRVTFRNWRPGNAKPVQKDPLTSPKHTVLHGKMDPAQ